MFTLIIERAKLIVLLLFIMEYFIFPFIVYKFNSEIAMYLHAVKFSIRLYTLRWPNIIRDDAILSSLFEEHVEIMIPSNLFYYNEVSIIKRKKNWKKQKLLHKTCV